MTFLHLVPVWPLLQRSPSPRQRKSCTYCCCCAYVAAIEAHCTHNSQQRVTRLQELVGDPRPLETKAAEVNTDVQVTLADYARRGRIVEEDILRNVAAVLPEELRALVPQPPVPPPTTTVVVEEEEEVFDYATFSATEVMEQQALAELADVKQAVASLQVRHYIHTHIHC